MKQKIGRILFGVGLTCSAYGIGCGVGQLINGDNLSFVSSWLIFIGAGIMFFSQLIRGFFSKTHH